MKIARSSRRPSEPGGFVSSPCRARAASAAFWSNPGRDSAQPPISSREMKSRAAPSGPINAVLIRFHLYRIAGNHQPEFVAGGSNFLIYESRRIAKGAGEAVLGHDPGTDFIGDENHRCDESRQSLGQSPGFRFPIPPVMDQIAQPERQAIDQTGRTVICLAERIY